MGTCFQGGALFVDHFFIYVLCLSCFHVCTMLGNRLHHGSLVYGLLLCFGTFSCGVLGRVLYLIVSIPDFCLLTIDYQDIKTHSCFKQQITQTDTFLPG